MEHPTNPPPPRTDDPPPLPAEYTPIAPERAAPPWAYAPFHLFFRPSVFFREYVIRPVPMLTEFAAWTLGVATSIDRTDARILRMDLSGTEIPFESVLENWGIYWPLMVAVGALSGLLYYSLGGWWYRRRLAWSGVAGAEPEPELARRVYLLASLVFALPMLLYQGWRTIHYASPLAAARGEDPGGFLVVAALFWSVVASYRGVCTAFRVRVWVARTWFLILPMLAYGMAFAALIGAMSFARERPNLIAPRTIERPGFSLSYPGNWSVDTQEADYDADHYFSIEPAIADALVSVRLYDDNVDPLSEIASSVEMLSANVEFGDAEPMDRWGGYEGSGFVYDAAIDGTPVRVRLFCANHAARAFEIWELAAVSDHEQVEPGFELIRNSFRMNSP